MSIRQELGFYKDGSKFIDTMDRLKEAEQVEILNTGGAKIVPTMDGLVINKDGDIYEFICSGAMTQFFNLALGSRSSSAWKYFEKQGYETQDKVLRIFNNLMRKNPREVTISHYDNEIMGVTSDKYVKTYDVDVHACATEGEFVKGWISTTGSWAVYETGRFEVEAVGDTCGIGYRVSNSQWGRRSLGLAGYVMRLACMNGATSSEERLSVNIRHVGSGIMSRFKDMIRSFVPAMQSYPATIRESLESTVDSPEILVGSVLAGVDKKRYMPDVMEELESFRSEIAETGPCSRYSIANAISRVGVDNPGIMRDMDRAAGIVYAIG